MSLRCIGAGIRNFTLTWVDCNGYPIISNQLTVTGPQVKLPRTETDYLLKGRDLNITVQKEMTSIGCRMVSTTFQSGYDVTSWFNFKVEIGSNFTVIVDKSTCDQVTFYCLNSENKTDEVDFKIRF